MSIKIGQIYKLNNRFIEIIHYDDVFSKPIVNDNMLGIAGMINSYVSIPLYNSQIAIGIIFEQTTLKNENDLFKKNDDVIISKVRVIGSYSPNKEIFKKGLDYYPTIGAEVFTVDKDKLELIYNSGIQDSEPTLIVGTDIFFPTIHIKADANLLFGKHLAVFGNTGTGKSCTVASILQGIYVKEKERLFNSNSNKLKTIIIDSNDEYQNVFQDVDPKYIEKKSVSDIKLSHKDLRFFELCQLLNESSPNVTPYLREAITKLKNATNVDDPIYYEFSKLPDAIKKSVTDNATNANNANFIIGFCSHLINRINGFVNDERLKCIFNSESNTINDFLKSDKNILILSLQVSSDVLSIITYLICKSIYHYKVTEKNTKNLLLVLEEAHRYISNEGGELINNYYVEKVAREGRKFGVNLLVSTQRPSEVSTSVISQCNTLIVHKITNARDLDFIKNTIEYEDRSQIDMLTSLKPQQALVLGEAFSFSSLIRIANADPLPEGETPKIFNE